MLAPGTKAPEWTAPDQDGNALSLSDLAGKWVAFWWYPKAGTPGWTLEGQGFRDRAPEFEAANAVIVGASFDTVEDQKSFADEQSFPYSLISDPGKEIGRVYDAEREEGEDYYEFGIPRRISYLIDPGGTIVKAYDLDGQDLSAHAAEVLADIAAAG